MKHNERFELGEEGEGIFGRILEENERSERNRSRDKSHIFIGEIIIRIKRSEIRQTGNGCCVRLPLALTKGLQSWRETSNVGDIRTETN